MTLADHERMAKILAINIQRINMSLFRKEAVRGFLMPNKGIIKSFANQGGTIEKL